MTKINNDDIYIGGKEKRNIIIVDYDPEWKTQYRHHAQQIRKALGAKALLLVHIGSTSVEGMAAKPVIDILVVVKDSSNESAYVPQMESAGYQLRIREPDWHEHRMFRTSKKDVHVHFYTDGCVEIDRVLRFRDWLRNYPEDCKRYETVKRELARQDWDCGDDYATAKTGIITEILGKANSIGPVQK